MEVLEAIRTIKKKKIGFVCPFIGCGKMFKRPWDVIAHFRVEVIILNFRLMLGLTSVKFAKNSSE